MVVVIVILAVIILILVLSRSGLFTQTSSNEMLFYFNDFIMEICQHHKPQIIRATDNFLLFRVSTNLSHSNYSMSYDNHDVTIRCDHHSSFKKQTTKTWKFRSSMDQKEMAQKVFQEMRQAIMQGIIDEHDKKGEGHTPLMF